MQRNEAAKKRPLPGEQTGDRRREKILQCLLYRAGRKKMMQFTPIEMATIYRQAADKRKQIRVLMDTNDQTEDEVKKSLLEGGILAQQFPRERGLHSRKAAGNPEKPKAAEDQSEKAAEQNKGRTRQPGGLSARLDRLHKLEEALAAGMRTIEEAIKAMEDAAQEAVK